VSQPTSILLVGAGPALSRLRRTLSAHFLTVESARNLEETRELALRCRFHLLVLVDPAGHWHELRQALEGCDGLPGAILMITDKSRAETAVEALRDGVSDVLLRPFSSEDLIATVNAVCRASAPGDRNPLGRGGAPLIGNSGPMQDIRALVGRIAPMAATVLIEGEPGTGRTLLARLLHEQSGRRGPLIRVDCNAIAGGVPDATKQVDATLFLANVEALPMDQQGKMLRNMEEGANADNRIVASTRTDLAELVVRQRFRDDLYHRLNVMRIALPPLRERRADIPVLAAHFIDSLSVGMGLPPVRFDADELEALGSYDWPGNVRELRELVEQALLRGRMPADALSGSVGRARGTPDYPLDWTLEQVKRHHMACVLDACDGNKSAAARRLDISRKTLDRKLGPTGYE
jgi:DNA-binding NtrC family response regulator